MLIDILPPISSALAVYPGDTPFRRVVQTSFESGERVEVSTISSTSHLGAHIDAELHYQQGGRGVDQWPLERFVGPCEVIHVDVRAGELITPSDISATMASRVLLCTGTYPDANTFNPNSAGIHPDTIDVLAASGCQLIGIDTPSVDRFRDELLPAHQRIAKHGLTILEGLVLSHVEPGLYDLIALPLRIQGGDASPVRAVLRIE